MEFKEPRFELDHAFFMCKPYAPEMSALEQAGFLRQPHTVSHYDQGTMGRYFYFDNFYIEFLWISDEDSALANVDRCATDMVARSNWREDPGVSPIGLGLRDLDPGEDMPPKSHRYKADWMRPGEEDVLTVWTLPQRMNEPWVFTMKPDWTVKPREDLNEERARSLDHPNGARVLTDAEITVVGERRVWKALRDFADDGRFSFVEGDEPLVSLTFDEGAQGETIDFRPDTSLVIHY
ncbi:MAG: hypothetical protein DHS20C14_02760 [Phycisphaeraceae bacterium]|nr:MAG: hypothetical protein DHS20C14_02760 [Phycisphaeraceae bacterium]